MNFIIGLTMAFLIKYSVLIWSNKNRPNSDGYDVLRLPGFYGYMGVIGLGVFIGVIITALKQIIPKGMPSIDLIIVASLVILPLLWLSLVLIMWTWVFEIRLNEEEIVQRGMLGKLSAIKWSEVKNVSFDSLSLQVTIKDGVNKIKCHQHSDGFEKLVKLINEKLNLNRQELGIPDY